MTVSSDKSAAPFQGGIERRNQPHLREIFEQVYRVAYPLLDSSEDSHNGTPVHFLRVVIHDSFPDLHLQDVAILSVAIERVYRERSKENSR
jgi:hypothetical protein